MNSTSTYVTRTPCYKAWPQPGGMTQECALIIRIMNGTSTYVTRTPCHNACPNLVEEPITLSSKHAHQDWIETIFEVSNI